MQDVQSMILVFKNLVNNSHFIVMNYLLKSWYWNFFFFHVLGAKTGKISDAGHDQIPLYGIGKNYSRSDAERLLRKLVIDAILHEDLQITAADTTACYIKLGPKANDVMTGKLKVEFILLFRVTCTCKVFGGKRKIVAYF